ncbi:hypothetical protein SAMN06297144_1613 [Sphingomonas guangdongensis]|uniref:DUF1440 domain-containing protein n=1 Tax=Sphingomonas guangdongensis TaxID=1141890 RepID=A0A285R2B6_9SPHN|nr:hypothetical protein [Sphingomonas guangdongensis]SOB86507.1 hypothetical protein SAMN06297144_1613 [Sphingomonas guangdongensis]
MTPRTAAVLGGLAAGVITTAAMFAGRKTGALGKTLDRDAVDWIDETTGSRDLIGDAGTSVVEFANHLGASAVFGYGYALIREELPDVPAWALGAGFGTALYAINIAGIAPLLGITEGEVEAGPRKAAERWGLHVLQSVATAVIAERLAGTSVRPE